MYLLSYVNKQEALWLALTLMGFTNIIFELIVFYRTKSQSPDKNGMVHRSPTKQESFVRSIPNGMQDDFQPLMQSFDGSVSDIIKAFQDIKTLYIIMPKETDDSRPSAVTDRAYSANPEMISDIENAINTLVNKEITANDTNSPQKRHSSI